jgi:hypothetical protein
MISWMTKKIHVEAIPRKSRSRRWSW